VSLHLTMASQEGGILARPCRLMPASGPGSPAAWIESSELRGATARLVAALGEPERLHAGHLQLGAHSNPNLGRTLPLEAASVCPK
jgi:hypothetical protein